MLYQDLISLCTSYTQALLSRLSAYKNKFRKDCSEDTDLRTLSFDVMSLQSIPASKCIYVPTVVSLLTLHFDPFCKLLVSA